MSDLGAWLDDAIRIERARASRETYARAARHIARLDRATIDACEDLETLAAVRDLLTDPGARLGRPSRGFRAKAPQTPRIVELDNRRRALERAADEIPAGANWTAMQD